MANPPDLIGQWRQAGFERLEYNEEQQSYHIVEFDELQHQPTIGSGWRVVCLAADSRLIRSYRANYPQLRGTFDEVKTSFKLYAKNFPQPNTSSSSSHFVYLIPED